EAAVEVVLEAAPGKTAAAVGPGLGTSEETQRAVRRLVLELPIPLVLDADGLNAFAGRLDEISLRRAATVLTPHPGELGRLLGWSTAEVVEKRLEAVRRAAEASGAVVVLKGHRTLVAGAGAVAINPTGNPGMGTGGTGDVLTGLLGSLLAQGLAARDAAVLAVFLHGLAGDLAAEVRGLEALSAGDVVEHLGAAFLRLRGGAVEEGRR
ncbi:MAG: NAD(P)H-hydrate dehydratase, partial [Acidobacteria bacterium]|nr:NAD(P)H-hydrate dehydratase [Acidobacteriota bacterium]